jgi:hypothetical protein
MVSRMISLQVECGSTEIQGRGLGKQARLPTKILARVGPWDWSGVTAPPNDSQVEGAALLPSPRSSKFFGSSGPGIFPNWPFPHGFPSPVVETFSRDLKTPENLSS